MGVACEAKPEVCRRKQTLLFFFVLGLVPIPSAVLDRCLWLIGLPWLQVGCSVASHGFVWNELCLVRLG